MEGQTKQIVEWVAELGPSNGGLLLGLWPLLLAVAVGAFAWYGLRGVDRLFLGSGPQLAWTPHSAFGAGFLAAWNAPLRGHLNRDAIGLVSAGRVNLRGALGFALGASSGPILFCGLWLYPWAQSTGLMILAAPALVGAMLMLAFRRQALGRAGGLFAGLCLLLAAGSASWEIIVRCRIHGVGGELPLPVMVLGGIVVGGLLAQIHVPRLLVVLFLAGMVQLELLPLFGLMVSSIGVHLVRGLHAAYWQVDANGPARQASQALATQCIYSACITALLCWLLSPVLLGVQAPQVSALAWAAILEASVWLITSATWQLLAPLTKRMHAPSEDGCVGHPAVRLPALVVLGAEDHVHRLGELAISLAQATVERNPRQQLQRRAGKSLVERQARDLRISLENLLARVGPGQRATQHNLRLTSAKLAANERFLLIQDLTGPEFQSGAIPPETLINAFHTDLVARANAINSALTDLGPWQPLTDEDLACLDRSLEGLFIEIDRRLATGELSPALHNKLDAQLHGRRRLTARTAWVADAWVA
ncbi:MAG: hypothetical protein ACI8QC_001696 [Planctomycetota bacterium]